MLERIGKDDNRDITFLSNHVRHRRTNSKQNVPSETLHVVGATDAAIRRQQLAEADQQFERIDARLPAGSRNRVKGRKQCAR